MPDLDPQPGPEPSPIQGVPSLYVHWPFCTAKCPYCDFNVHIAKTQADETQWIKALLADLDHQMAGQHLAPLQSLYFGGGTPSLLSPRAIGHLIDGVLARWPAAAWPQITLEVHPNGATQAKFADFAAAGVNRVSLGVQSFDDRALDFLGRDHSAAEARAAVAAACATFDCASLDLMTALPGRSLAWQSAQVAQALSLGLGHVSVYQLGIEPGTAFGAAVRRGDWTPMDADEAADLYEHLVDQMAAAGLHAYEVSNFAKPGHESRHSWLGWRGHGYLGIGPGAEGRALRLDGVWERRITRKSPAGYLKQVATLGHGLEVQEALSAPDRAEEQLIFGLRLQQGLPLTSPAWGLCAPNRIAALLASGDLEETQGHRRATPQGRLRLDALTPYLLTHAP